MPGDYNKIFGSIIANLIEKNDLTKSESKQAFIDILEDRVTSMQQGAFLAALKSKGECAEEVAGAWEAIFDSDTYKVELDPEIDPVENSGTGMDSLKTYNISTAASIIAASGGVPMARHGSRGISSLCGTVDLAEELGVDVECSPNTVVDSIRSSGLGLFNGMSSNVHPCALGRLLSGIYFGTTLNLAASLANPALPSTGVRGVYSGDMLLPVARVMREIGYKSAIVLHGCVDGTGMGMDEASVCGTTYCMQLFPDGTTEGFKIDPASLGMNCSDYRELEPEHDRKSEAERFAGLISNRDNDARKDAAILNAALVFLASGHCANLEQGIQESTSLLEKGAAFETMQKWVYHQNHDPDKGLKRLYSLIDPGM